MSCLFQDKRFDCRVSSVLNKNVREFGKNYMFDNNAETCWNSDAGTLQWVLIAFQEDYDLSAFEIQFQGGFAGKTCHIEAGASDKDMEIVQMFFPEDINSVQRFTMNNTTRAKIFKVVFSESTDFFGRIIIYKLSFYS